MDLSNVRARVGTKAFAVTRRTIEAVVKRCSTVGDQPFFELDDFPWHRRLEENHHVIRRELPAVLTESDRIPAFKEVSPDQVHLTQDDKWKTFFLYASGHRVADHCATCPETAGLLEGIPGMKTAMFSVLAPHKDIPEHRGPYGGVLRYHLGVMIPEPRSACGIVVGGEHARWDEGRSLIFDDSFQHVAWNHTDHRRVVLFVDFERPVRPPCGALNR